MQHRNKPLNTKILLSVHITSILFLVQFNNFALTTGFYWSYIHALTQVARSYVLLVTHVHWKSSMCNGSS